MLRISCAKCGAPTVVVVQQMRVYTDTNCSGCGRLLIEGKTWTPIPRTQRGTFT